MAPSCLTSALFHLYRADFGTFGTLTRAWILCLAICSPCLQRTNHPFHLPLLHRHNLCKVHNMQANTRVELIATIALRNVVVETAHPSSLPLSSHLSALVGQMSGFQIGVRRGHVAGFAMHADDYTDSQLLASDQCGSAGPAYRWTPTAMIRCIQTRIAVLSAPTMAQQGIRILIRVVPIVSGAPKKMVTRM